MQVRIDKYTIIKIKYETIKTIQIEKCIYVRIIEYNYNNITVGIT